MDQTTAMHMFEAFYSTKDGGSGLGLPTARKGIEAHGGRIDVQSEVGGARSSPSSFPLPSGLQVAADRTPGPDAGLEARRTVSASSLRLINNLIGAGPLTARPVALPSP